MIITNVTGDNFCSIQHVEFNVENKGLIAIQGENLDDTAANSNGAGKSSLVDLICWTLTGSTARGSSGDAIIRRGETESLGCVELKDDKFVWKIIRTRTKGKEKLELSRFEDKICVTQTQGTNKLTQERIYQIIGCNEDVFRAAIYIGQEDLPDLPRMTDKQLKYFIEKAAGVEILERAYEIARQELSDAVGSYQKLNYDKHTLNSNLSLTERSLKVLHQNKTDWADFQQKNQQKIENDLAEMTKTFNADRLRLHKMPSKQGIENVLGKLKDKFEELDKQAAEEQRLIFNESSIKANIVSKKNLMISYKTAMQKADIDLATVNNRLGNKCNECGSIITEDHLKDLIAAIEKKKEATHDTQSKCAAEIDTLTNALQEAQKALKDFQAGKSDPTHLSDQRVKLTDALKDRKSLEDNIECNKDAITKQKETIEDVKKATNPFEKMLQENALKIVNQKAEINDLQERIDLAEALVEQLKQVVEVFSPAGVRAQMLDEITPYLNSQTAKYLTVLSDGAINAVWNTLTKNAKGEYRERFAIEVSKLDGGTFNDLSGGEKRKVRLACALALQDLVASRATKPFNFVALDEIDAALDDAGLERLMVLLQEKAKEKGTIMIISHNSLSDWIPNVWKVIKKDGKSELVI